MKTDYQNKKIDAADVSTKTTQLPATTEYNFPQHNITIVAASLEEAYAILQSKLQDNTVTE